MAELHDKRGHANTEHLARVRALSQEVQTAISALEKNDLELLRKSLASQETLCNELLVIKSKLMISAGEADSAKSSDPKLSEEVRQAHVLLSQLNRVYTALLKRSSRTVGLIAGLYRCYGLGIEKQSTALNENHTWSCEV